MTTKVWFEVWNVTDTPYKACQKDFASEMEAELYINRVNYPSPTELAYRYEIRQVVQTISIVNTLTIEPRAIMSVEEIANNAISDAMGTVYFDIRDTEDYNLLSKEDKIKVNDLFNMGVDCCNTCGIHVPPEELDENGDCDGCAYVQEEEEEED